MPGDGSQATEWHTLMFYIPNKVIDNKGGWWQRPVLLCFPIRYSGFGRGRMKQWDQTTN